MEPSSTSAPTHVAIDLPCVECGYNLRTLTVTSLCPECGRAVSDSLPPMRLAIDASTRTKLQRCALGLALIPPFTLTVMAISVVLDRIWQLGNWVALPTILVIALPALYLSIAISFVTDVHTAIGPSCHTRLSGNWFVVAVAVYVVATLSGIVVGLILTSLSVAPIALKRWTAGYARRFASRVNADSLNRHARVTRIGLRLLGLILLAVGLAFTLLSRIFEPADVFRFARPGTLGVLYLSLIGAYILVTLLHASLMFRVHRWLRRIGQVR